MVLHVYTVLCNGVATEITVATSVISVAGPSISTTYNVMILRLHMHTL